MHIPELDEIPDMHAKGTFAGAEAYAWHRDKIAQHREAYDPRVLARIVAAAQMSADDYRALQERRARFIAAVTARVSEFDALIAPTVPIIAPRMSELVADDQYYALNGLMLRNPTVVNLLNGCAISLPCHRKDEPPVGLSLIGLHGTDETILHLAKIAEPLLRA